jgi:hypothetical protein
MVVRDADILQFRKPKKEQKTVMAYGVEAGLLRKIKQHDNPKYRITYKEIDRVEGMRLFFLSSPSYYLIARCSDDPTEEEQRMLASLDQHAKIMQDPDSINPGFKAIVIYDTSNGYKRDLSTNILETNPETLEGHIEEHMQFLLDPLPFYFSEP